MTWSKVYQMITKWIFSESAWKGLLKNVQDEIPPLEAEKFTKQKCKQFTGHPVKYIILAFVNIFPSTLVGRWVEKLPIFII